MLNSLIRHNARILDVTPTIVSQDAENSTASNAVKPYNDPFHRDNLKQITIYYRQPWSNDSWKATGNIVFKQGNTEGTQQFEAATIELLLEDMARFVQQL